MNFCDRHFHKKKLAVTLYKLTAFVEILDCSEIYKYKFCKKYL